MKFITNHRTLVVLVLIVIIATFFRLYNLDTTPPGLYPDEAINGNNAVEALETNTFKVFYPENNGREGLYINIQALSIKLFGAESWALRAVSALFGILTVIGLFLLLRKLFSKIQYADWIAALPAFLLAISFWHINFSRIGFRAIMAPMFLVFALYFLILAFFEKRNVVQGVWMGIAGIVFGLGMHSYIAYRVTPLLIIIVFIAAWRLFQIPFKRTAILFALFVITSLISFAPLGIHFLNNPDDFLGRTSQISVFDSPTFLKDIALNTVQTVGMLNVFGDYNWRHNYTGRPQLYWIIGIMFWIGLISELVIVSTKKLFTTLIRSPERTFATIMASGWILIGILPVIISSEGIPHALRAILIIPPIFFFAGMGIWNCFCLLNKRVSKKILIDAGILLGIMLIFSAYATYFWAWGKNINVQEAFSSGYKTIGVDISNISDEFAKYVVVNASGVMVRDIPMPAQSVMFFSDSFVDEHRTEHNIHYILPHEVNKIPPGSIILYLEPDQ